MPFFNLARNSFHGGYTEALLWGLLFLAIEAVVALAIVYGGRKN